MKITILSAWEKIDWSQNSFGIYGYDIIIDQQLRPWLIEVNKCPALAPNTQVLKVLLPRFFEDVAKVMIDYNENKNCDTGELELLLNYDKIKEPTEARNDE